MAIIISNFTKEVQSLYLRMSNNESTEYKVGVFALEDKAGMTIQTTNENGQTLCKYKGALYNDSDPNPGTKLEAIALNVGTAAEFYDDCTIKNAELVWNYEYRGNADKWQISPDPTSHNMRIKMTGKNYNISTDGRTIEAIGFQVRKAYWTIERNKGFVRAHIPGLANSNTLVAFDKIKIVAAADLVNQANFPLRM